MEKKSVETAPELFWEHIRHNKFDKIDLGIHTNGKIGDNCVFFT